MAILKAHEVRDLDNDVEPGPNRLLAMVHPASQASVNYVLAQSETDENGRSNWVWVRLPNGDLILGVYPQADTYCAVEADAHYREV